MAIQKLPSGTRGGRNMPGFMGRLMMPLMVKMHRRSGDAFSGMNLLYLTTRGAKSGELRTSPVARFDDGRGGWFIVASAGGAVHHPGWYHNLAAHPDEVSAELGGTTHRVTVEQLEGAELETAWQGIVAQAPRFTEYRTRTDRPLPVLRLTPQS